MVIIIMIGIFILIVTYNHGDYLPSPNLPSHNCKSFHSGIGISWRSRARARAGVAAAPAHPGVRRVARGAAADPDALPGNQQLKDGDLRGFPGYMCVCILYICLCIYIYIYMFIYIYR